MQHPGPWPLAEELTREIWAELRKQDDEGKPGPMVVPSEGLIDGRIDLLEAVTNALFTLSKQLPAASVLQKPQANEVPIPTPPPGEPSPPANTRKKRRSS
jgi:hypothetical protein